MAYFPFMIDISNKNCLVVGGGSIAFHKVKLLTEFGVHIQVIAPRIDEPMQELAEKAVQSIELVERRFQEDDIAGMDFVVAATDDKQLNCHISDLCMQKNILINSVDMPEVCSFIFPAMIKDKDLLIAVSSGGKSPAAAAYMKRKISHCVPEYSGEMIETIGEYRAYILEHVDTAKKRKEIFNQLLEYGDAHEGKIPKEVVENLLEAAGVQNNRVDGV